MTYIVEVLRLQGKPSSSDSRSLVCRMRRKHRISSLLFLGFLLFSSFSSFPCLPSSYQASVRDREAQASSRVRVLLLLPSAWASKLVMVMGKSPRVGKISKRGRHIDPTIGHVLRRGWQLAFSHQHCRVQGFPPPIRKQAQLLAMVEHWSVTAPSPGAWRHCPRG